MLWHNHFIVFTFKLHFQILYKFSRQHTGYHLELNILMTEGVWLGFCLLLHAKCQQLNQRGWLSSKDTTKSSFCLVQVWKHPDPLLSAIFGPRNCPPAIGYVVTCRSFIFSPDSTCASILPPPHPPHQRFPPTSLLCNGGWGPPGRNSAAGWYPSELRWEDWPHGPSRPQGAARPISRGGATGSRRVARPAPRGGVACSDWWRDGSQGWRDQLQTGSEADSQGWRSLSRRPDRKSVDSQGRHGQDDGGTPRCASSVGVRGWDDEVRETRRKKMFVCMTCGVRLQVREAWPKATTVVPNGLLLFPQQISHSCFFKVTAHNSFCRSHNSTNTPWASLWNTLSQPVPNPCSS
jgi:hypothetical protein